VPVRITPDVLARLDAYAERADITRSEAVRQLIEAGLKSKR
jgi:metal-responsive CopG/Arc/MetJ family transcriptional regulator